MSVIGRINGPMLRENLLRLGVDLAFETDLLYLDVNNGRIGIKRSVPTVELDVNGNALFKNNLKINGTTITSENTNGNITLTPNGTGRVALSYLTSGRIPLATTSGTITDSANLTFSTDTLTTVAANVGNIRIANNHVIANNVDGNVYITPNGTGYVITYRLTSTNLTSGRVVYVGTGGQLIDSANLTFDGTNLSVSGNTLFSAAQLGNITFSNVTVSTSLTNANLNLTANGTGYVNATNLVVTGTASNRVLVTNSSGIVSTDSAITYNSSTDTLQVGNLTFVGSNISSTSGNIILTPASTNVVKIDSNTSLQLPSGLTGDRPGSAVAGMLRWNSSNTELEYFNGSSWQSIISTYGSTTSDTFNGDGSTVSFTLSQSTTSTGVIVSINGVLQKPTVAYNVTSGTTLTFTEAPLSTDVIEARIMTTATSVSQVFDVTTGVATNHSVEKVYIQIAGNNKIIIGNSTVETSNATVSNVTGQSVGNSLTTIDTWAMSTYSAAKYIVVVSNGTAKQVSEVLLTHNSSAASHTQYTVINTGSNLGTISSGVSGSNVELRYTGASTGNTVKLVKHYVV